ncbi:phosphopantetheine-binding protein [Teredinibacter haidensis]|uniref:phosphopantetheine-binding protein n=1 Tax=Teredinibacter haidensis TaxID=2731755 RepID=UPI00094902BF|nr:phosphopantetheine-binding protein [Teredinibacter haidensis]
MKQIDEIIELLHATILRMSPYSLETIDQAGKVFKESYLVDLGINSIDYAEIVTTMMENLKIGVPLNNFCSVNRVDDIAELIFVIQKKACEVCEEA